MDPVAQPSSPPGDEDAPPSPPKWSPHYEETFDKMWEALIEYGAAASPDDKEPPGKETPQSTPSSLVGDGGSAGSPVRTPSPAGPPVLPSPAGSPVQPPSPAGSPVGVARPTVGPPLPAVPPVGLAGTDWLNLDRAILRPEITAAVMTTDYEFICHQGLVRVAYSRDVRFPPTLALLGAPQNDVLPFKMTEDFVNMIAEEARMTVPWWDPRISAPMMKKNLFDLTDEEIEYREATQLARRNSQRVVRDGGGVAEYLQYYLQPKRAFTQANKATLDRQKADLLESGRKLRTVQTPYDSDDLASGKPPSATKRRRYATSRPPGTGEAGPSGEATTAEQRSEAETASQRSDRQQAAGPSSGPAPAVGPRRQAGLCWLPLPPQPPHHDGA